MAQKGHVHLGLLAYSQEAKKTNRGEPPMNKTLLRAALPATAFAAALGMGAVAAHADSNADYVHRYVTRSATHTIAFVAVTVECSPDTDSEALSARLTQLTPAGTVQTAQGTNANIGAFECTGDPETVFVPIRRPAGGFNWQAGTAVVSNVVFYTHDENGNHFSVASKRTVIVK